MEPKAHRIVVILLVFTILITPFKGSVAEFSGSFTQQHSMSLSDGIAVIHYHGLDTVEKSYCNDCTYAICLEQKLCDAYNCSIVTTIPTSMHDFSLPFISDTTLYQTFHLQLSLIHSSIYRPPIS